MTIKFHARRKWRGVAATDRSGKMNTTRQKLLLVGKLVLTVVLILVAFAVVIPNCMVPPSAFNPGRFAWRGLFAPLLISGVSVYCVWWWK